MLENSDLSGFQILRCYIYHADNCLIANDFWHFNIYEHDKFYAQLSWAWKECYNLGAWSFFLTVPWAGLEFSGLNHVFSHKEPKIEIISNPI